MPKDSPSDPSTGTACNQAADSHAATCPVEDQVVLERLIEEVSYDGSAHRQEPPTRKQYVNLDPSASGGPHYDFGRVIYLRAKLQWSSGDASRSLAGNHVYWKIEPDAANRADVASGIRHGFNSAGSGTVTKSSTVDSDGWTPVVEVHLSNYGGDVFVVRATENNAYTGGETTGSFTVWKKIFYTLGCMSRTGGTNYSNRVNEATLVSEYASSFVELSRVGALSTPAHQLLVEWGDTGTWASTNLPASTPRTLNFGLIDTLAIRAPIPFTREADPPGNTFSWTLSGGSYAFDLSAQNRWLTRARYYDKRQAEASRVMHNLPNNKVTLTVQGLDYRLRVDVSGAVSEELPRNHMHVVLELKKRDFMSGQSRGAITIVAMRWREKNYSGNEGNATLHTMYHEAGHYLGLGPKKLPDTAQSDNPYYYDDTTLGVGIGNHCSYPTQNPATAAALPATPGCIMYHSFKLTMDFCPKCSESLRGRDLSSPPVRGKTAGY